jgi:signal peptidase I
MPELSDERALERAKLERDAMAWPPAAWERSPGSWRADLQYDAEPFVPYVAPVSEERPRRLGLGRPATSATASMAREVFETVVLTALMFVAIRIVVQNFRIDGQSMEPTLHTSEYLLVNKISYRYSHPQRGDIIVFDAWGTGKDYIKRVIGLPGETLDIKDDKVWINGQPLDEPYTLDGTTRDERHVVLGEDQYYVLGDNRANSQDSRAFGPLDGGKIIGKAWVTYWPMEQIGTVDNNPTSFASSP